MELKNKKNKNQGTDCYETDKRPRTEKLKEKEITLTEKLEKNWNRKKAVMQSGYPWNQSEDMLYMCNIRYTHLSNLPLQNFCPDMNQRSLEKCI